MKKVTYSLIVIIIALILIVFVWPYIMGTSLRSQVYEMAKNGLPKNGKLNILSYHMGWLNSKMNLEISIPVSSVAQAGKTKMLVLDLTLNVANGPIIKLNKGLTDKSWGWGRGVASGIITIVEPSAKNYPQFVGLSRPIQFEAWVHWGGSLTMFAHLPAGDWFVDKQQGLRITSGDITENATTSKNFDALAINVVANNIDINQNNSGEAHISSITYRNNAKKGDEGLWLGEQHIVIPQVSIVKQDQNLAQVQNITVDNDTSIDNNKNISSTLQASVNKISAMGQQAMGPFNLDLSVNNIKTLAVKNLQKNMKMLSVKFNKTANPAWSQEKQNAFYDEETKQFFAKLQPLIVDALTGVEVKLNTLSLDSAAGKTQMTGELAFPNQSHAANLGPNTLLSLAMAASAHLDISLSYPIALGAATMLMTSLNDKANSPLQNPNTLLRELTQQGLIKQTQYEYSTSLDYKNQQVTVNGKALETVLQDLQKIGIIPTPQPPQGKANNHARQETAHKSAA